MEQQLYRALKDLYDLYQGSIEREVYESSALAQARVALKNCNNAGEGLGSEAKAGHAQKGSHAGTTGHGKVGRFLEELLQDPVPFVVSTNRPDMGWLIYHLEGYSLTIYEDGTWKWGEPIAENHDACIAATEVEGNGLS
jgi:hypothetical protein